MFKYNLLQLVNQSLRNVAKTQFYLASVSKTTVSGTESELVQSENLGSRSNLPSYTWEQQQKILNIVNKDDVHEILIYDIAKARAAKLATWKKRNGPLKNIEDILLIDGFGTKFVDKFYKSMVHNKGTRTVNKRSSSFISPTIDVEHRRKIRSCVALRIGVSSVTWARLELPELESSNQPSSLTHWQHHEITEKKLHLSDLVQRLLYVNHLIPKADCYIFENPQMAQINSNPGSVDHQNVSIQKSQVIAVLSYALFARDRYAEGFKNGYDNNDGNDKTSLDNPPNVFYMRRFLAARLFSQLVGTERVLSEEAILKLMRIHYNSEDFLENEVQNGQQNDMLDKQNLSQRCNVQFPPKLREMFSRAERYQREILGQSLLLNLAFVRLVLLQDQNSIAAVTRSPNKEIDIGS